MTPLLRAYRFMATVVGVLLIVLCLVGVPLNHAHDVNPAWIPEGSDLQRLGDAISAYLGVAHGWLYMIFVIIAFVLSRREQWPLGFTITTIAAGTVPILSFWGERRATQRVARQHGQHASV